MKNLLSLKWHLNTDTPAVSNKQEQDQECSQRTLDRVSVKKENPKRNPVCLERIERAECHLGGSKVVYVQRDIGILRTAVFRLDLGDT